MRQCENIFVFIDLTKSIGSDLRPPPPNSAYGCSLLFIDCQDQLTIVFLFAYEKRKLLGNTLLL